MANTGKSKKGLIIGVSLLVATGVGLFVWHLHKKKKEKLLTGTGETNPNGAPGSTGQNTVTPPVTNTGGGSDYKPVNTISSDTNPISVQSGSPKDVLAFQKWCNKNKGTTLTEDGFFTRIDGKISDTKKAWDKYGLEYQKIENMKLQPFAGYKGNPIGKVVYSKYVGSDIFDGTVADNVFTKIEATTKIQPMGKVAKVLPTNTGSIVVFSGAPGKFYKMHSSHLNIFA